MAKRATGKGAYSIVPKAQVTGLVLPALMDWVLNQTAVLGNDDSPFPSCIYPGFAGATVVGGDNASGKSLVHRLTAHVAHDHGIEPVSVSIRERTNGGVNQNGMRRMMMFGDEDTSSTGSTSIDVVQKSFRYISAAKEPIMLLLDEPEVGLSESYTQAFGELIGKNVQDALQAPDKMFCGLVLISHSKSLCRGLAIGLQAMPGFVHMAAKPKPFVEWLDHYHQHSVEDLLVLKDISLERYRAVRRILHPPTDDKSSKMAPAP